MSGDPKRIEGTPERQRYLARMSAQTLAWAMGKPYHNREDDECCPDFSCCDRALFTEDAAKRWDLYRQEREDFFPQPPVSVPAAREGR